MNRGNERYTKIKSIGDPSHNYDRRDTAHYNKTRYDFPGRKQNQLRHYDTPRIHWKQLSNRTALS